MLVCEVGDYSGNSGLARAWRRRVGLQAEWGWILAVPCNRPYARKPLDPRDIARDFGIDRHIITKRLHTLKRLADLRGDHAVIICLDYGEA